MMIPQESVISKIFKPVSFTPIELTLITNIFEEIHLKKGAIILKPNQRVLYKYFVKSGCLRSFYIDKSTKEHTVQFAIKNWWMTDILAYFTKSKSTLTIETLQESTVYKVSKKDLEELFVKIPKLETFFRIKMEKSFALFQQKIIDNTVNSAEERYVSFLKKYPDIEKSVKNYHIASFLGIRSESLSRIRKNLKF